MEYAVRHKPGRPRATRSADTRERILNVARDVFGELGYDAATFQSIALRADLTRPAINHYFSSKRELYLEVLERANGRMTIPAVERGQRETSLMGRLSSLIFSMVEANAQDRSLGTFLVSSVVEAQRHPELGPVTSEANPTVRDFLTWAINEAVADGEIVTDSDTTSLVEMLTAIMWGLGLYAGYLASQDQLEAVTNNVRLLLANELWRINGPTARSHSQ